MAECTLFGGLVPNVYIDKVFIEEYIYVFVKFLFKKTKNESCFS